ncbi:MAG: hypothetical protein ACI8QS_002792 [Planctomycetota bacterium]|jgi:hypothetical protein
MDKTTQERTTARQRKVAYLLILLSVALHAPSLGWGFFADDHMHELVLEGNFDRTDMKPWALYDFGVLADRPELRDSEGAFPFWTAKNWRAQFLRPVSSICRWAEHVVFNANPVGAHMMGLLWWSAFLVLSWRLFLALGLGPRASLWALALLSLENGAVVTVGWLANRNSVVEGVFLLSAMLLFVRGSREGTSWRIWCAFLCACLATLSKESGIATFALIAGWSWLGRRSSRTPAFERGRLRWASIAVALAVVYVLSYIALGYGTKCAFYPTPWGEPGVWLSRLIIAVPAGVVATTTPMVTDVLHTTPALVPWCIGAGVAIVYLLGRLIAPVVKAHGAGQFLLLWIFLTLAPQASAPLSDRLFLMPMVAVAGLLGLFLEATRLRRLKGWALRSEVLGTRCILVSCIIASGLGLFGTSVSLLETARFTRDALREAEVGPASLGRRDVIVLQSPSQLVSLQPSAGYAHITGDDEVRFWTLSATRRGVTWTRTGERTFELTSLEDVFLSSIFESVFLVEPPNFKEGEVWITDLMTIHGYDMEDGRPRRLVVEVKRDLADENLVFLAWRTAKKGEEGFGKWERVTPPEIGISLHFPTQDPPLPFLP